MIKTPEARYSGLFSAPESRHLTLQTAGAVNAPLYNQVFKSRMMEVHHCKDTSCKHDATPSTVPNKPNKTKELVGAAGLILAGLLTHQLPARAMPGVKHMLPTDPKVWLRVILGIAAVQKINKAFQWQPPPWLGGMEAVAVITPIAMKFTPAALKQVVMMAPIVGLVVQGAHELNKRITDPLKDKFSIPPFVTRLGIALSLAAAGLKASKLMGIGGAVAMTCARGCTPGSLVCLSELGEMATGMKTWFKSNFQSSETNKN